MAQSIDKNRISFNSLGIEEKAKELGLLTPIKNVPKFNAGDYKGGAVKVDLDSPENKEKLVNVSDYGIKNIPYYLTEAINNPTYNQNISGAADTIYAREGTCKELQKRNQELEQLGLELIIYDAHRSPSTQRQLYRHFLLKAYEKGKKGKDAENDALNFCSNPEGFDKNNPDTWTIHSTGGAIDLYLMDKKSGKVIDMGEGHFDNPEDVTNTKYYEDLNEKGTLSKEQQGFLNARRILYNVMTREHENGNGFVNYGNELFHYDLNDPYYALVKGVNAKYGYKESPKDKQLGNILGGVMQHIGNKR